MITQKVKRFIAIWKDGSKFEKRLIVGGFSIIIICVIIATYNIIKLVSIFAQMPYELKIIASFMIIYNIIVIWPIHFWIVKCERELTKITVDKKNLGKTCISLKDFEYISFFECVAKFMKNLSPVVLVIVTDGIINFGKHQDNKIETYILIFIITAMVGLIYIVIELYTTNCMIPFHSKWMLEKHVVKIVRRKC